MCFETANIMILKTCKNRDVWFMIDNHATSGIFILKDPNYSVLTENHD